MTRIDTALAVCSALAAAGAVTVASLLSPVVGLFVALSLLSIGAALVVATRRRANPAGLGAVEHRLAQTQEALDAILDRLVPFTAELGQESEWTRVARRLGRGVGSVQESTRRAVVRDIAALLTLHRLVDVKGETPPLAPWVALPETVLALVDAVRRLPSGAVVVDIGSGLSTVWLALAAAAEDRGIRIISFEHDETFARATRANLGRQGLDDAVDLRVAPLEPISIDGDQYEWYAESSYRGLDNVHLVFVDGPPGSTSATARYPALPLLASALVDGAVIVLDDANRSDEKAIIEMWGSLAPAGLTVALDRELGNAAVLRVSRVG